jgi:hypothetical protein
MADLPCLTLALLTLSQAPFSPQSAEPTTTDPAPTCTAYCVAPPLIVGADDAERKAIGDALVRALDAPLCADPAAANSACERVLDSACADDAACVTQALSEAFRAPESGLVCARGVVAAGQLRFKSASVTSTGTTRRADVDQTLLDFLAGGSIGGLVPQCQGPPNVTSADLPVTPVAQAPVGPAGQPGWAVPVLVVGVGVAVVGVAVFGGATLVHQSGSSPGAIKEVAPPAAAAGLVAGAAGLVGIVVAAVALLFSGDEDQRRNASGSI